MAFTTTMGARAFSTGPGKEQHFNWSCLATDTTGTVTANALYLQERIFLSGSLALTAAPTYATNVATLAFTSPAVVLYTYTVSSANATVGALYASANGASFSVAATIAGATTLTAYGDGAVPAASGTLTKIAGTGDASITYSAYTVPTIYGTGICYGK